MFTRSELYARYTVYYHSDIKRLSNYMTRASLSDWELMVIAAPTVDVVCQATLLDLRQQARNTNTTHSHDVFPRLYNATD